MAKATVRHITAFDATKPFTVNFSWNGSISSNTMTVYETSSNHIVYNHQQTGTDLTHVIPANTLQNGSKYYVGIVVTDSSGNPSEMSNYTFFGCFAEPHFAFSGMSQTTAVSAFSHRVTLEYSQAQSRALMSYVFYLYDVNRVLLASSNTFYDNTMAYTFRGLEDSATYYVRCVGKTVDDVDCDTGYYKIDVNVKVKNQYYALSTTNDSDNGFIRYSANVIKIEYTGPDLSFAESFVDAREKPIYYDRGINLTDDFLFRIDFKDLSRQYTGNIITLKSDKSVVAVDIIRMGAADYRFRLTVVRNGRTYTIYSAQYNLADVISGSITIIHKKGLYEIVPNNISVSHGRVVATNTGAVITTNTGAALFGDMM